MDGDREAGAPEVHWASWAPLWQRAGHLLFGLVARVGRGGVRRVRGVHQIAERPIEVRVGFIVGLLIFGRGLSVVMRKDFSEIEGKAKALSSPLAHRMAEITMVRDELSTCLRAAQLWVARVNDDDDGDDAIIHNALFRDCVIQFTACFGEDDDHRLNPAQAFDGFEGALEFFGWLRDVRNAYAAHRFGALRQVVPMLVLDDARQKRGVGHLGSIYRGPSSAEDKENPIFVFSLGLACATQLAKELNRQVQLELEPLSPNEVEQLPDAQLQPLAAPEFIRMTRENYRKAKSRRKARQQYRRRPVGSDPPPQKS